MAAHTAKAIMMLVVIILKCTVLVFACKGSDNLRAVQSSFMCIFIQPAEPLDVYPDGIYGVSGKQRITYII